MTHDPPTQSERRSRLIIGCVILLATAFVALVVGFFSVGALVPSKIRTAETEVSQIEQFLDSYYAFQGEYPEDLDALVHPPGGMAPVTQEVPLDPWGAPYFYRRFDPLTFELCSRGPDGRLSDDDIYPPHRDVRLDAPATDGWFVFARRCGGRLAPRVPPTEATQDPQGTQDLPSTPSVQGAHDAHDAHDERPLPTTQGERTMPASPGSP